MKKGLFIMILVILAGMGANHAQAAQRVVKKPVAKPVVVKQPVAKKHQVTTQQARQQSGTVQQSSLQQRAKLLKAYIVQKPFGAVSAFVGMIMGAGPLYWISNNIITPYIVNPVYRGIQAVCARLRNMQPASVKKVIKSASKKA